MFQILAVIPLICSIGSVAANNPYYPSKEYSASVGGSVILPLPSIIEADNGDLMMADAYSEYSASLYYNDETDYILTNFSIYTSITFYTPSRTNEDVVDYVSNINFTCTSNAQLTAQNIGDYIFFYDFYYVYQSSNLHCKIALNETTLYEQNNNCGFYIQVDPVGFRLRLTLENLANDINRYIGGNMGYNSGYDSGYNDGYANGYTNGQSDGYQTGYTDGYEYADNQNATALVIFQGIISIGLLPINFFLAMLNFEVFGINIGGAVSAMLTIAIVVIIVRIVVSGGNGGKE